MSEEGEDVLVFSVAAQDAAARLDAWLAKQCAAADLPLSRSRLKNLILEGAVSIDDEICVDPSCKIKSDMDVALLMPPLHDKGRGALLPWHNNGSDAAEAAGLAG